MKKSLSLAVTLLALNLAPVFGQALSPEQQVVQIEANRQLQGGPVPRGVPLPPPGQTFQQRLQAIQSSVSPQTERPVLTKFNLDFAGGPPGLLVKAIEKATGKPLNVIIPTEGADVDLPPLKMNDVDVPQLFAAVEAASHKTVAYYDNGPPNSYSTFTGDYGFQTADSPVSDSSIWYFHATTKHVLPPMPAPQKVCQFYSLSPFLERGFTVDDITTAIQTGWKMEGPETPPELNYHKETRMLIAFGEPQKLNTISAVLNTLPETQDSFWRRINTQVGKLQQQVDELNKRLNPPPVSAFTNSPAEKSGK